MDIILPKPSNEAELDICKIPQDTLRSSWILDHLALPKTRQGCERLITVLLDSEYLRGFEAGKSVTKEPSGGV